MRTFLPILFFSATTSLPSCLPNQVNTKHISKDLGITLPKNYKIIDFDSDPFGLGADADIIYVFQFDSLSYSELVRSIEASTLFNTADEKGFDTFPVARKKNIIETLAESQMTSYWIRSDSDYVYDGNALIINEPDRAYLKVFNRGTFLPNQDGSHVFDNGEPVTQYQVRALVDRRKRILYYRYVHI